MAKKQRPDVPPGMIARLRDLVTDLPECREEDAWVGLRWRVGTATFAHVFGGEDGLFRIIFKGEPGEVMAFQHLGSPYFKASWGQDVIGMLLNDDTDWDELGELLTDSYCLMAPAYLAEKVARPST
ncbi:MAG TPA: MmcQ/YjbR family DNA-binding protein [Marmoricola sp.]|nr:MmcQ/YjbR family DNA-binding protein [Marmoricola sp.]